MFIDTVDEQYPGRVLKQLYLRYTGFSVLFDLPSERQLKIEINVFAKEDNSLEVYEHVHGVEPSRRYWLAESRRYEVSGIDPLPLLEAYLKTTIGGIEHSYEGSFAEVLLKVMRSDKQ